eukprot:3017222-Amphidinium_carterae.1
MSALRKYRACPSRQSGYGTYLGEFLFRMRFLRAPGGNGNHLSFLSFAFSVALVGRMQGDPIVEPACR